MSGLAEILAENQRLRESEERLQAQVSDQAAKLEAATRRADFLAQELEFLRSKRNGPRNERFEGDGQGMLPFEAAEPPPKRLPQRESTELGEPGSKAKPKRRNLDENATLERKPVRCKPSETPVCTDCKHTLKSAGLQHSKRVDYIPGRFVILEVACEKYRCEHCSNSAVLTVPSPFALPKALCGNGLLAKVLVDKTADHIPLNRQAKRMKREGFEVATSTLSSWVKRSAGLLKVVADAIRDELLAGDMLQSDDTGLPVQDGTDGKLRKGRMWVATDQTQAFYWFSATKEGEVPTDALRDFQGELLLVDGGSEYNQAVRKLGLKRAGCWSHLRRYFHDARMYNPDEAEFVLSVVRELFLIERHLRGRPPDDVRALRQEFSKPLVDKLFAWLKQYSKTVRPKSKIGEAVGYALNQRREMQLFLEHPELPLHNNLSELLLRQPVVGRKNWLFAGSEGGAQAAATLYTLVSSCMLQAIDPHEYLVDVLNRLPDYPANRVSELTPLRWSAARG